MSEQFKELKTLIKSMTDTHKKTLKNKKNENIRKFLLRENISWVQQWTKM